MDAFADTWHFVRNAVIFDVLFDIIWKFFHSRNKLMAMNMVVCVLMAMAAVFVVVLVIELLADGVTYLWDRYKLRTM